MNNRSKLLLAAIPVLAITACGDSDVANAIGTSEPQVRMAHAAVGAPNVTLQRNGAPRSEATNVAFGFVSNYFNVDTGTATWSVNNATSNAQIGAQTFDARRGHKYSIFAVADTATTYSVVNVDDPTNRSLTSDDSVFRVFNGSRNAAQIDVYLNGIGQSIANVNPNLSNIGFKNSGPASGNDGLRSRGGDYQVTVTTAGTKTVLFRGNVTVPDNRDVLLFTVPNDAANPTGINLRVKLQGDPGSTVVPSV